MHLTEIDCIKAGLHCPLEEALALHFPSAESSNRSLVVAATARVIKGWAAQVAVPTSI